MVGVIRFAALGILATAMAGCGGDPSEVIDVKQSLFQREAQDAELCSEACVPMRHAAQLESRLAPALEAQLSAPLLHPAVDAQPRSELEWWVTEHERINAEVQQKHGARLLFIGDSITWGWSVFGNPVWDQYYLQRRPLNLGIIGDQTQNVLWRLRHGNLDGLDPKVVVLMIGVNNAFNPTHEPRHIAAGVAAILDELKRQRPHAKVLLLGILPANKYPCSFREKLAETNHLLARLQSERVRFLDIGKRFLDDEGTLPAEIAFDYLHLTEDGYGIWARGIEPALRALLDEPLRGTSW